MDNYSLGNEGVPILYVVSDAAGMFELVFLAHLGCLPYDMMRDVLFYKDCQIVPLHRPSTFGGLLEYRSSAGSFIVFGGVCEYHLGQALWTRSCVRDHCGIISGCNVVSDSIRPTDRRTDRQTDTQTDS